jgi:exopolysaccharide biosynthesis polyprenyl glycosylphosphotransferase
MATTEIGKRSRPAGSAGSTRPGEIRGALAAHPTTLWQVRHVTTLVIVDAMAIWLALTLAAFARFGVQADDKVAFGQVRYGIVVAAVAAAWLLALAGHRSYEPRFFGVGPDEYKRVCHATLRTFGLLAIFFYAAKMPVARGFVAVALPAGLVLLLVGRFVGRRRLVSLRLRGHALHRVLAVGNPPEVAHLTAQLLREPHAGFSVVAAATPGDGDVLAAVRAAKVDTVAVTGSAGMTPERLRELAWDLENTGVSLIVAPSLTDVAGPRITVRPVGGLPLLYVDEPEFRGLHRVVKSTLDRVAAATGLLVLSPMLLAVALAVRLTTRGPALFRQRRIGAHGREFHVFKFRTMYEDAEQRFASLLVRNEGDGLLFKIRDDPRITPLGRLLRRTSLDELPQLLNVVRGDMSLVGPRPLAVADSDFQGHVRRRLLVKPGMTGLWQVNGRSDQSWEDAVRLDLYYVENWSITLDLLILLRTVKVVFGRDGAY